MKQIYTFFMGYCVALLFAGCNEDTGRVVYPYSCPQMSGLTFSFTEEVTATDSIWFSVEITDPETPLSTLEVEVTQGEQEIFSGSIRTAGYATQVSRYGIYIPFTSQMEEGEARITLTAINVEGSEARETKTFTIRRPQIPQTIYLHYADQVIPMTRDADNPYAYVSAAGDYPNTWSGKISTAGSLAASDLIWGYAETNNQAELVSATGAGFSFNFPDWQIDRVTFNTFTFRLGVIGFQKDIRMGGVLLEASDGYFQAGISFVQGEEVEVTGIEDLEGAYNRDFFDYDPQTGKLTFLRESGYWEVYYSSAYNYIWVTRMDDVAPDAFWLLGHGFICAPVWHEDFDYDGWHTDEVARLGYVVKIAEHTYQTTIYLNDTHEWDSFEIEIYSDREWEKNGGMELQEGSLSGDVTGFAVSGSNGFTNAEGFVPGYYRLTFDTSEGVSREKMFIERIGD